LSDDAAAARENNRTIDLPFSPEQVRDGTARKPVMSVEDQCRMFARMLVEMTDRLHQQDHRIADLMQRIAALESDAELMQRVAGLESDVALLGMAANMTRHGSDRE
jgi:hypothetical protein